MFYEEENLLELVNTQTECKHSFRLSARKIPQGPFLFVVII